MLAGEGHESDTSTLVQDPTVASGGEAFDSERAWKHLVSLVALGERPSGTPANARARRYITETLRGMKLEPVVESFTAATPIGQINYANVYVDLPPTGGAPGETAERTNIDVPIVVLCTHFDTKLLPFEFIGANDGGSGTAVLLELARCLIARPSRNVTYRILFLDGEEALRSYWAGEDNCYGSRHHVRELRRNGTLERVKACVLLDMVGDADLRLTREQFSDARLIDLFFGAARRLGLDKHVDATAREIKDDHLRFLDAGVPSVNLIDFDYGAEHEHWHRATDRLENCSRTSLGVTGRIVQAGLPELEAFALRESGSLKPLLEDSAKAR